MMTTINTHEILKAVYKVHSHLGPGLLESAYETCLHHELINNGFTVQRQLALPLIYDEVHLDAGYRIDLLVEGSLVIEVKSVESIHPIHLAQVITYLKLSSNKLGYLLNFNVRSMKEGIQRVVNNKV
jgi:GxxExxY protein